MVKAERDFIVEKVKEVLAAPSCCAELKEAARNYLDALDTDREKEAGKFLVAELEEDVQDIDSVLRFFSSDAGRGYFGAEKAAEMAELAKKVKAEGGKTCFCPACAAGQAILDKKEALL